MNLYFQLCSRLIMFLSITLSTLFLLLTPSQSIAHGYVAFPKARQAFCQQDGGYWWPQDGSAIPNSACRAAFIKSGTYQFVQSIEFAALVADYHNMNAVKAKIPDQTLCAGGHAKKSGMDVPHANWQTTQIILDNANQFELLFFAATPHNPSFWQIYLSKPEFDPSSDLLHWDDLDLIAERADQPTVTIDGNPYYRFKVKIPQNRQGRAVLYTRWQRNDPAGEGFYNCSDIVLEDNVTEPTWHQLAPMIQPGLSAKAGEEVWARAFDHKGDEQMIQKVRIDQDNETDFIWADTLAQQINQTSDTIQVGELNAQGTIDYNARNRLTNRVYSKHKKMTFRLDVRQPTDNMPPKIINFSEKINVLSGQTATIQVEATDVDQDPLSFEWSFPKVFFVHPEGGKEVQITAPVLSQSQAFHYNLSVSDGQSITKADGQIIVQKSTLDCIQTDPNADHYPTWVNGKAYQEVDRVNHQQLIWEAKYWTKAEPSFTAESWQLKSQIQQPWKREASYPEKSIVHYQDRKWQNQWWSKGDQPGETNVWVDQGASPCKP